MHSSPKHCVLCVPEDEHRSVLGRGTGKVKVIAWPGALPALSICVAQMSCSPTHCQGQMYWDLSGGHVPGQGDRLLIFVIRHDFPLED